MRKFLTAAALAAAAAASACQSTGPGPEARTQPRGFEGQWVSADGVAYSSFTGGAFETVAADTGNKLANGSYVLNDPNSASITVNSLIRQTTSRVNCALVSPTQMNCTSESGQQFTLVRRVTS